VLLPLIAHAQAAREGNEYDFRDHQPTAQVQSQEKAAGVAPDATQSKHENQTLGALDKNLMQRASRDAKAVPAATNNVYGVQPGGIIHVTPNPAGGAGGAATAGSAGQ
jgi:hypothetical protein